MCHVGHLFLTGKAVHVLCVMAILSTARTATTVSFLNRHNWKKRSVDNMSLRGKGEVALVLRLAQ